MKVRYVTPPWGAPEMTKEGEEFANIMAKNVWSEAAVRFYAEREAKIRTGQRAPKGMSRTLNSLITERLLEAGWSGDSGYFVKNDTWVRVTFRHQMSIGSDFIDAIKVCKKEGIKLAIIAAAGNDMARIISPNDWHAVAGFEKIRNETMDLNGVIDIPLLIGELIPMSSPSDAIANELMRSRPRDITIPNN